MGNWGNPHSSLEFQNIKIIFTSLHLLTNIKGENWRINVYFLISETHLTVDTRFEKNNSEKMYFVYKPILEVDEKFIPNNESLKIYHAISNLKKKKILNSPSLPLGIFCFQNLWYLFWIALTFKDLMKQKWKSVQKVLILE